MWGIIARLAKQVYKKRIAAIEFQMQHPDIAQEKVFYYLINKGKHTHFGKEHDFYNIKTIEDFQKKVPIRRYEALYPYIERVLLGEKDVLWPGKVEWFAKSSGTTNDRSKFIPITQESLEMNHYLAGKDMIAVYIYNRPGTKIFSGKVLSIGGSHEISRYSNHARYGDLSAVLIENMPWFYNLFRAPAKEIALMAEWEAKIEQMARATLEENITGIAGVPTWTIVLINKLFELCPCKERNLFEIWPHLEVFFHGAVNFDPYRAEFEKLCPGDQMRYMEIYNASEGYFAFEHAFGRRDMMLLLSHGVFYEFLPLSELDNPLGKTYTITEVELNKPYAMVISTNGGLWRYLIGDTVVFTDKYPYTIRIAGRTRHYLNAFGEEVMVENAERAITLACEATGAQVSDFTAAPIYFQEGKNAGHEWIIEFSTPPDDYQRFLDTLDDMLKVLNSDYEAKRYKDIALKPPIAHFVPHGTFYEWMKRRGKLGGQNKVPRLSNDRKYVESILSLLKELQLPYHTLQATAAKDKNIMPASG